ncbi:hypothetical protein LTR66_014207 [Elasticomyces elasticus]|nr:hypothetical protein LTR66_014207 [Elasticomyces elasticus]
MYLSAVSTCAKNFGRGKHKGIALALPIAAFGLSGMWQSQIGEHLLLEKRPDGRKGTVDVYRYFLFLGCLLLIVGLIGVFALKVVDEDEMIDEAVDELERSGLLEDSDFFHRTSGHGYGTIQDGEQQPVEEGEQELHEEEERRKKTWLLNSETRRFLSDHTMWWLAAGFFLVTGPGEAFINNLGTILDTLHPPSVSDEDTLTSPATHVSIVAITSTLARILTGSLTDLLAPTSTAHQHRRGPESMANSMASLPEAHTPQSPKSFTMSRVTFLLGFSLLLSIGQVVLASGMVQGHDDRFWLVSGLIGAGYGAIFSLTPIIVSVVWGVENFGTNWGIVATVPAAGATVWGLIYSGVYQWAAERETSMLPEKGSGGANADVLCHGRLCYAPTFWGMAVSVWVACGFWIWAWKGRGGWSRRGIAV